MEVVGRSIYIFLYEHQYFYVNINIAKKLEHDNNIFKQLNYFSCIF
jgi:hypothetical protein